jgi:hypothetical protein
MSSSLEGRIAPFRLPVIGAVLVVMLGGCTNTRIDEQRVESTQVIDGDAVVVLGRRHNGDYETEPDFVNCIGNGIDTAGLAVISEQQFMDSFYPWFEPRNAPMNLERLDMLMQKPGIAARAKEMKLRYIVWVDGSTQTTDKKGSLACGAGPGGAGCLGFGMWEKESNYEAKVWDVSRMQPIASVSANADGTSYMPAVIVPIPLIARVQAAACNGLSNQLHKLFSSP